MGIAYSFTSSNGNLKPSTLLPRIGNGEYEVGCADIMIEGDNGVFARIFYPSKLKIDKVEYPVWRPRSEYIEGLAEYRQVSSMKINFFLDWIIGEKRIAAGWHQPFYHIADNLYDSTTNLSIKPDSSGFPVVVFSHGISGNRLIYSTFCSSLASHGFVVAAVEHRDQSSSWTYYLEKHPETGEKVEKPLRMTTFPDGEEEFNKRCLQVQKRVDECIRCFKLLEDLNLGVLFNDEINKGNKIIHGEEFDWSQFKGRLDVSKSTIIGHSFGGATAIAAPTYTSSFQTSVVLDGWLYPLEHKIYSRASHPTLLLNASKWQWKDNVKRMFQLDSDSREKIIITFKDIVHQTFSDFGYLAPGYFGRKFALQGNFDPSYTGQAIIETVVVYLKQFFSGNHPLDSLRKIINCYKDFMVEGTDIELEDNKDINEVSKDSVDQTLFPEENKLDNKCNFFNDTDQKQTLNCGEV